MARGVWAPLAVVGLLASLAATGGLAGQESREQPEPETYHWLLPVNQAGVDVATLHPNDCYVIEDADGLAYFGEPSAAVLELQRQLTIPVAHLVETREDHTECTLGSCLRVAEIAAAIERELQTTGVRRLMREVGHRPSPLDHWFGGAYTDVGSENRQTYSNTPEQRMLFQHLDTRRRSNCYEAKVPRTLSVHVRDLEGHTNRSGVYHGFLYVEHHHPLIVGETVAQRFHPMRGQS